MMPPSEVWCTGRRSIHPSARTENSAKLIPAGGWPATTQAATARSAGEHAALPTYEPPSSSRPFCKAVHARTAHFTRAGYFDALEGGEVVVFGELLLADHHGLEARDLLVHIFAVLAHKALGHHRGRGLGDGAAPPGELHVGELVPVEAGVDGHLVAAEGVEEVLLEVIVLQFAPVAGSPVMVHEDLRVELAHHAHLAKAPRNRRAPSSAVSRASTSSSVL